jgi:hypothetical protein
MVQNLHEFARRPVTGRRSRRHPFESTKSSTVTCPVLPVMPIVHCPPLTAMAVDVTFVKTVALAIGVVTSAPPQFLAVSCAPVPFAFAQTDNV